MREAIEKLTENVEFILKTANERKERETSEFGYLYHDGVIDTCNWIKGVLKEVLSNAGERGTKHNLPTEKET